MDASTEVAPTAVKARAYKVDRDERGRVYNVQWESHEPMSEDDIKTLAELLEPGTRRESGNLGNTASIAAHDFVMGLTRSKTQ